MKYNFDEVKKAFLKLKNGDDWNAIIKKYPRFRFSDMDDEMKDHMNKFMREMASPEQRENPNIHYELKKSTGQK